ncbi:hypothetical protein K493DRAFT_334032 [Basidiobolus meristosporus CBS 931.73]|uniref:START domain-containing protein n=1 Tax=Basidiobolus meristosporus CBS 931.73 TaxID=1314790 RepID=A0A1Y1Z2K4_9FUNG|nr:hypothetical protein K493DRAFT_334032 [Basidiobolus meristosporus CBS 931.73]|eukprot:ORY04065.1 hypothetical protein K493DRAFT_334032 [Basidiobolus meristosporus CBS 931.73]
MSSQPPSVDMDLDHESAHNHYASTLTSATAYYQSLSSVTTGWRPVSLSTTGSKFPIHIAKRTVPGKTTEVVRGTALIKGKNTSLDDWKAVLECTGARKIWDRFTESSTMLETLSPSTRITRTILKTGWPKSQRDLVVIENTVIEEDKVLFIATSVPSTGNDPIYLRKAPNYIRANLDLMAVSVETVSKSPADNGSLSELGSLIYKALQVTVYYQVDLKGWKSSSSVALQSPLCINEIYSYLNDVGVPPHVQRYGKWIQVNQNDYHHEERVFELSYSVVEIDDADGCTLGSNFGSSSRTSISQLDSDDVMEISIDGERWCPGNVQVHISVDGREDPQFVQDSVECFRYPDSEQYIIRISHLAATRKDEVLNMRISICPEPSIEPGITVNHSLKRISSLTTKGDNRSVDSEQIGGIINPFDSTESVSEADSLNPKSLASSDQSSVTSRVPTPMSHCYSYFNALLSEPDSCWRQIGVEREVTISKLDVIKHPTGILKGVAEIEGYSMWDFSSTIQSPGTRKVWDRMFDEGSVTAYLEPKVYIEYNRLKAIWPTSPRDMVVMMANHVSSKAIYTFGFSTDEGEEPSSSNSSCVRAQLDIAGWHFEDIGENRVRVTYIVQMDPKGWIPSSLLNMLTTNIPLNIADVVDYLEMHGAPPNVLTYDNCSIIESDYNHRKNLYTLRYKVFSSRAGNKEASAQKHSSMILRLDYLKWTNEGNAVVEMEANSVVENFTSFICFKTARDFSGMRLEIQHKPSNLLEEDLLVTMKIRKASPGSGFKINGYRVTIWNDRDEALASGSHSPKLHVAASQAKSPRDGQEDRSEALKSSASSSRSDSVCDLTNTPPLLSPKELARTSIELLRRLQSEPDESWSLVSSSSKTGLSVYKQYISEISSSMPTLKGVKVIEGFAPEDIASVICSPGCRKAWDDTFDTGMVLEILDNGFTIAHQFVKGLFPLKARDLVTITCTYASPSPTSTIYFSCTSVPFSPNIVNSHVRANLPLYGWTCELVDPYQTSTNYPIPSTKVSIFALLDLGGSVPSSLSNMVTPKLPKHILNVESYLRAHGPPPYVIQPKQHMELTAMSTDARGRDEKRNQVEINGKAAPTSEFHHFELSSSVVLDTSFEDSSNQYKVSTMFQLVNIPDEPETRNSSSGDLIELQMEFVVVLDLVIDLRRYPYGYGIQANLSPGVPFAPNYATASAPVAIYVVDIPPAPSYSTSLKPSSKHNKHMIRVVQYVCRAQSSAGSDIDCSGFSDGSLPTSANWVLNFSIEPVEKSLTNDALDEDEWNGRVLINKQPIQVVKSNDDKLEVSEIVRSLYKIQSNGVSGVLEEIIESPILEPIGSYSDDVGELGDTFVESVGSGRRFSSSSAVEAWAMGFNRLRPRSSIISRRNSLLVGNRHRWMHTSGSTKTARSVEEATYNLLQVVGLGFICFVLGICIRFLAIDPWCNANPSTSLDGREAVVLFSAWFGWDIVLVRR